ncbi:MAG: MerR family transcriptional regulator [Dehalococcoidia bacterium]|nr:MerR family transcriptional regulator [Dehalococcoidia bacterium]
MTSSWEPRYIIGVAARMVGVEAHTLRYYEKLGLIQPHRSEGNIRFYSQDDVDRLRYVKTLMCDLGVNFAGVEVALHLMQKMKEMQCKIEEMETKLERLMKTNMESDIEWWEE